MGRKGFLFNSWFHLGPRFFEKPLNEGTFEKGLASAKYAAIASNLAFSIHQFAILINLLESAIGSRNETVVIKGSIISLVNFTQNHLFFSVLPYTLFEIKAFGSVTVDDFAPKTFLKRYFQLAPVPGRALLFLPLHFCL